MAKFTELLDEYLERKAHYDEETISPICSNLRYAELIAARDKLDAVMQRIMDEEGANNDQKTE